MGSLIHTKNVRSAESAEFHCAGDRLWNHNYTSREEFDADVAAAPGVAAMNARTRQYLTEEQKEMIVRCDPYAALMYLKRTAKPTTESEAA